MIRISRICAASLLWLAACQRPALPSGGPELHRQAGRQLCQKMISCLRSHTRTLREESRRTVTVEACVQAVDHRLSQLPTGPETPEDTALARDCYEKELALDCRDFLVAPFRVPSCQALTARTLGVKSLPVLPGL